MTSETGAVLSVSVTLFLQSSSQCSLKEAKGLAQDRNSVCVHMCVAVLMCVRACAYVHWTVYASVFVGVCGCWGVCVGVGVCVLIYVSLC